MKKVRVREQWLLALVNGAKGIVFSSPESQPVLSGQGQDGEKFRRNPVCHVVASSRSHRSSSTSSKAWKWSGGRMRWGHQCDKYRS